MYILTPSATTGAVEVGRLDSEEVVTRDLFGARALLVFAPGAATVYVRGRELLPAVYGFLPDRCRCCLILDADLSLSEMRLRLLAIDDPPVPCASCPRPLTDGDHVLALKRRRGLHTRCFARYAARLGHTEYVLEGSVRAGAAVLVSEATRVTVGRLDCEVARVYHRSAADRVLGTLAAGEPLWVSDLGSALLARSRAPHVRLLLGCPRSMSALLAHLSGIRESLASGACRLCTARDDGAKMVLVRCRHAYHRECYERWIVGVRREHAGHGDCRGRRIGGPGFVVCPLCEPRRCGSLMTFHGDSALSNLYE